MKVHLLKIFGVIVFSVFILDEVKAEYDVAAYCQLVPTGTKFPSLEACHTYYTCLGNGEFSQTDCTEGKVFDKDKQDCVGTLSSTNCFTPTDEPCSGLHDEFAANKHDCHAWHYCENGVIKGNGTCPSGQKFDGKMCIYGTCNNVNDNGIIELSNVCDIMPMKLFFADLDNCAYWKKCKSDKTIRHDKCNSDTSDTTKYVFDVERQACVPSDQKICTGPNEDCDDSKNNTRIAHSNICSAHYICQTDGEKYFWKKIDCPNNQYYDVKDGECKSRQKASPAKDCDRCQYSTDKWVNGVDSDCKRYLYCNNGVKVNEGVCNDTNVYFNEQRQQCVLGEIGDYATNNGACKKETNEITTSTEATTDPANNVTDEGLESTETSPETEESEATEDPKNNNTGDTENNSTGE